MAAPAPLRSGLGGRSLVTGKPLAVAGDRLYVAGDFATAGGVSTGIVAAWSGSAWETVGAAGLGFTYSGRISDVAATSAGDLVVAGAALEFDGRRLGPLAILRGATWEALGPFARGTLFAPPWVTDALFVGGVLFTDGGTPVIDGEKVFGAARWDGQR